MWKLKGCPRCKGDLELDRDEWGWYEQCIQCGYMDDKATVTQLPVPESRTTGTTNDAFPSADGTVYRRRKGGSPFSTPPLDEGGTGQENPGWRYNKPSPLGKAEQRERSSAGSTAKGDNFTAVPGKGRRNRRRGYRMKRKEVATQRV